MSNQKDNPSLDKDRLDGMLKRVRAHGDRDIPWARPMAEMYRRHEQSAAGIEPIEMLALGVALRSGEEAIKAYTRVIRESGYRAGFMDGQGYQLFELAQSMLEDHPGDQESAKVVSEIEQTMASEGYNVSELKAGSGVGTMRRPATASAEPPEQP
jgi:hypothetical protein